MPFGLKCGVSRKTAQGSYSSSPPPDTCSHGDQTLYVLPLPLNICGTVFLETYFEDPVSLHLLHASKLPI